MRPFFKWRDWASFFEDGGSKSLWKVLFVPVLIFLGIALFILRDILFIPGTIGLYQDWAIGPTSQELSSYANMGWSLFDPSQGNKVYTTDWMLRIALTPFTSLGGEVVIKGLLLGIVVLSGLTMYYLGRTIGLRYFWALVIGVIYIFSPIIFTRIIPGYVYYLIAYSIAPLMVAFFLKAVREVPHRWRNALISGALLGLMGSQIQFLVMGPLIILAIVVFDYKKLRTSIPVFLVVVLVCCLIEMPWALPLALGQSNLATNLTGNLNYPELTSAPSLLESARMLGYGIHTYSYIQLAQHGNIPGIILVLRHIHERIGQLHSGAPT